MKIKCGIIEDLLPLYVDNICTDDTKEIINEHIKECDSCKETLDIMKMDDSNINEPVDIEKEKEKKTIKNSFKKIKRRWIISLICMFMIIPLGFSAILVKNQFDKSGICFTNLKEINDAKKFFKEIKKGNYEKAASYMNFESVYEHYTKCHNEIIEYKFKDVVINGKKYKCREEYSDLYDFDNKDFWKNCIESYKENIIIPQDIWNKLCTNGTKKVNDDRIYGNPQYVFVLDKEGKYNFNEKYRELVTSQGTFYINMSSMGPDCYKDSIEKIEENIYNYSHIIPENVYAHFKETSVKNQKEYIELCRGEYKEETSMTKKEYVEERKRKMVKLLESFEEEGYKIKDISYNRCIYLDEKGKKEEMGVDYYNTCGHCYKCLDADWEIVISILVEKNYKIIKGEFYLFVKDGKIFIHDIDGNDILFEFCFD